VTPLDVARKALELIDASPEFKYSGDPFVGCAYLRRDEDGNVTGEGDCLFGQALISLGVPVEYLDQQEGNGIETVLAHLETGESTPVPGGHLTYAQWAQDDEQAWGSDAVRGEVVAFIEGQE